MNVPLQTASEGFTFAAEQMTKWMEQVLGPDYRQFRPARAWAPSINLYEDDATLYLVADLGGMDPERIDLRAEEGRLVIQGERPSPCPGECKFARQRPPAGRLRPHVMEIDNGPFYRSLELPGTVDADAIEACYQNGFLCVRIPKKA